jgi:hypothetical protein
MALDIEKDFFLQRCREICESFSLSGQVVVTVSERDSIQALARNHWQPIVDSCSRAD